VQRTQIRCKVSSYRTVHRKWQALHTVAISLSPAERKKRIKHLCDRNVIWKLAKLVCTLTKSQKLILNFSKFYALDLMHFFLIIKSRLYVIELHNYLNAYIRNIGPAKWLNPVA
jgi:hypothetical protein